MTARMPHDWPLDAMSVRMLADQTWLEDLHPPVTGMEFQKTVELLQTTYGQRVAALRASNEGGLDLLYVLYHLPLLIAQFLLRRATIDRIASVNGQLFRAGQKVDFQGERTALIKATLEGSNRQLSFRPRFRSRLRILGCGLWNSLKGIRTERRAGSLWLSTQREIIALGRQEGLVPFPVVPPACPLETETPPNQEAMLRSVLEELCAIQTPLGSVEKDERRHFIDGMMRVFGRLEAGLAQGAEIARRQGAEKRELIVGGAGHLQNRLHAAAWRMAGGTTIATAHGNTYLTHYRPGTVSDGFLSLADRYVTTTRGEATAVSAALKDFDFGFPAPHAVTPLPHGLLSAWRSNIARSPERTGSPGHVALMGHPLNLLYYPNVAGQNSAAYLGFEYYLGHLLRSQGFRVTYKAHPETTRHLSTGFLAAFDAVETAPIERTHRQFDHLLFAHPFTSSFGFAMLTDRPIVLLLDPSLPRHEPDFSFLSQRCKVVWSRQDDSGRMRIDDDSLIAALNTAKDFAPLPEDALH